jgi:hypothetical protein
MLAIARARYSEKGWILLAASSALTGTALGAPGNTLELYLAAEALPASWVETGRDPSG